MNSFHRRMISAVLFTMILGLYGCESGTDSSSAGEASDTVAAAEYATETITVVDPWIRPTPPGQTVTGAFMTLVNDADSSHALIAVNFSDAGTAEIHETSMNEGRMRMQKVDQVEIPANGSAELKPGSYHIMLIGLTREMKAGTVETLNLTFSDGSEKTVEAMVGTPDE